MSNKLAKHQKQKERLTGKQKKVLFWSCFAALSIAFLAVWLNVFLTSNALDRQMEEMVLGEDYDREDVVITDKKSEDATADNAISQNYFFYYHGGKTNEYNKRMQVPESVYTEYEVGDTITAYTTARSCFSGRMQENQGFWEIERGFLYQIYTKRMWIWGCDVVEESVK